MPAYSKISTGSSRCATAGLRGSRTSSSPTVRVAVVLADPAAVAVSAGPPVVVVVRDLLAAAAEVRDLQVVAAAAAGREDTNKIILNLPGRISRPGNFI